MFGFRGFGKGAAQSQPAALTRALERTMELVSREDIYRATPGEPQKEPVLLLKKGHTVALDDLPRYIRYGVQPAQFQLRYRGAAPGVAGAPDAPMPEFQRLSSATPATGMRNSVLEPVVPGNIRRSRRTRKRVLVLESDPKSLKRMIDCLFVCGIGLSDIQPLRLADQLTWALEKHRPDILIIDYRFRREDMTGLRLLQALDTTVGPEKVILTLPADPQPHERLSTAEEMLIRKLSAEGKIALLPRPVSRFALSSLLAE